MFDVIWSRRDIWFPIKCRYLQGGQWEHDSANLVCEVVIGINEVLYSLKSPLHLKVERYSGKKPDGFQMYPVKKLIIIGGVKPKPMKFKVSKSRVQLGKRVIDIGHEDAVQVLIKALVDEMADVAGDVAVTEVVL